MLFQKRKSELIMKGKGKYMLASVQGEVAPESPYNIAAECFLRTL
jgi:hypothetical protein